MSEDMGEDSIVINGTAREPEGVTHSGGQNTVPCRAVSMIQSANLVVNKPRARAQIN